MIALFWILSKLPFTIRYSLLYVTFLFVNSPSKNERNAIRVNAIRALGESHITEFEYPFYKLYRRHQASAIALCVSVVCGGITKTNLIRFSGLESISSAHPKLILLDHFGSFGAPSLLLSAYGIRTSCISYVDANSWYTSTWEPVVRRYFPGFSHHQYIETPSRNLASEIEGSLAKGEALLTFVDANAGMRVSHDECAFLDGSIPITEGILNRAVRASANVFYLCCDYANLPALPWKHRISFWLEPIEYSNEQELVHSVKNRLHQLEARITTHPHYWSLWKYFK
ncbi:MAG: hypothetical protein JJ957_13810 [Pseudomonadales bacterium]|nr:hypothetical protein [Pseudomonadales bacterium]MBO6596607.1 hypothetical protein [Pseudomonadales bacterium]MBO6823404.1 hypothetical protein [Pseudomonadales bacterium]